MTSKSPPPKALTPDIRLLVEELQKKKWEIDYGDLSQEYTVAVPRSDLIKFNYIASALLLAIDGLEEILTAPEYEDNYGDPCYHEEDTLLEAQKTLSKINSLPITHEAK